MRPHAVLKVALVTCLVVASIMLAGPSAFGQGRPPGAGGGGGGGGHTESAVNNLSYPAVKLGGVSVAAALFSATRHVNGETYSYACAKPEVVGTTTYPNTSCAIATTNGVQYLTAEACMSTGPCSGFTVDRVYWQKILTNYWKAQEVGATPEEVDYLDWGDNLESKSWTATSTIRLETVPFAQYETPVVMRGYQMWHVLGQGPDEQWGVRTTDSDTPVAYVYDSPYAIIHTGNARLNIAKLFPDATACPSTGPAYSGFQVSTWQPNVGWAGACPLSDGGFTAELNVGGKYVYGYNWAIRRDTLPTCNGTTWNKAGWWRLTFYTNDNKILFWDDSIPLVPPTVPGAAPALLAAESETGSLYKPVIDTSKNLTFIDICILGSGGGGGKK